MNEIRAVSFRLVEEDIQKFREIAEQQGLNQAEMFQSLMNSFEMAKAKNMITDRAKEIEVFQDTVNNLMSMFINSLAINQTSEERIRETLSLELNTKDKTIADLQEYKEKMKSATKVTDEKLAELEKKVKDLTASLEKTTKELEQKTNIVDNQQKQINTLNSIVTEYKVFKAVNKELESKNNELNNKITDVLHNNADIQNKLDNTESMKEFYKNELYSLKNEVKELNRNLKEIEQYNKDEIKALNKAYSENLSSIENKFSEDMNNKIEFEKSKHQLELDRAINKEQLLRNEYDNLKEKYDNLKKSI